MSVSKWASERALFQLTVLCLHSYKNISTHIHSDWWAGYFFLSLLLFAKNKINITDQITKCARLTCESMCDVYQLLWVLTEYSKYMGWGWRSARASVKRTAVLYLSKDELKWWMPNSSVLLELTACVHTVGSNNNNSINGASIQTRIFYRHSIGLVRFSE